MRRGVEAAVTTITTDDDRRAYVESLLKRLRVVRYSTRQLLPRVDGEHDVGCRLAMTPPDPLPICTCTRAESLSLVQLQRLYRSVLSEGYGQ